MVEAAFRIAGIAFVTAMQAGLIFYGLVAISSAIAYLRDRSPCLPVTGKGESIGVIIVSVVMIAIGLFFITLCFIGEPWISSIALAVTVIGGLIWLRYFTGFSWRELLGSDPTESVD
jgi:hypothetical protein